MISRNMNMAGVSLALLSLAVGFAQPPVVTANDLTGGLGSMVGGLSGGLTGAVSGAVDGFGLSGKASASGSGLVPNLMGSVSGSVGGVVKPVMGMLGSLSGGLLNSQSNVLGDVLHTVAGGDSGINLNMRLASGAIDGLTSGLSDGLTGAERANGIGTPYGQNAALAAGMGLRNNYKRQALLSHHLANSAAASTAARGILGNTVANAAANVGGAMLGHSAANAAATMGNNMLANSAATATAGREMLGNSVANTAASVGSAMLGNSMANTAATVGSAMLGNSMANTAASMGNSMLANSAAASTAGREMLGNSVVNTAATVGSAMLGNSMANTAASMGNSMLANSAAASTAGREMLGNSVVNSAATMGGAMLGSSIANTAATVGGAMLGHSAANAAATMGNRMLANSAAAATAGREMLGNSVASTVGGAMLGSSVANTAAAMGGAMMGNSLANTAATVGNGMLAQSAAAATAGREMLGNSVANAAAGAGAAAIASGAGAYGLNSVHDVAAGAAAAGGALAAANTVANSRLVGSNAALQTLTGGIANQVGRDAIAYDAMRNAQAESALAGSQMVAHGNNNAQSASLASNAYRQAKLASDRDRVNIAGTIQNSARISDAAIATHDAATKAEDSLLGSELAVDSASTVLDSDAAYIPPVTNSLLRSLPYGRLGIRNIIPKPLNYPSPYLPDVWLNGKPVNYLNVPLSMYPWANGPHGAYSTLNRAYGTYNGQPFTPNNGLIVNEMIYEPGYAYMSASRINGPIPSSVLPILAEGQFEAQDELAMANLLRMQQLTGPGMGLTYSGFGRLNQVPMITGSVSDANLMPTTTIGTTYPIGSALVIEPRDSYFQDYNDNASSRQNMDERQQ